MGRRVIGISGSVIWSKTLMELIFKLCGESRWSPKCPVSQIHSPLLHAAVLQGTFQIFKSIQMLEWEWGAENKGKLPHLSIPSKTVAWVPEFAVEDLPLSSTVTLVPEFAVKDLPLGRTLWSRWMVNIAIFSYYKKVKVSSWQAMKTHGGCGCKGSHIHSHGTWMR